MDKLYEALMYAGIYNVLLTREQSHDDVLTWSKFKEFGHEAYMMRFSRQQVHAIWKVFKKWQDSSGRIVRDNLTDIFRATFMPKISEQEVNGVATVFNSDSSTVTADEFVAILSRFVRRHEQDWNLLRGIREVLQKAPNEPCVPSDMLSVEELMDFATKHKTLILGSDAAEEMLWCAACYSRFFGYNRRAASAADVRRL